VGAWTATLRSGANCSFAWIIELSDLSTLHSGWNMGFGVTTRQRSSPRLRELVIRMCVSRASGKHIFVYARSQRGGGERGSETSERVWEQRKRERERKDKIKNEVTVRFTHAFLALSSCRRNAIHYSLIRAQGLQTGTQIAVRILHLEKSNFYIQPGYIHQLRIIPV